MRVLQMVSKYSLVIAIILFSSCNEDKLKITDPKDYDQYLRTDQNSAYLNVKEEISFWSKRLRPDTTGIGDLIPLANSYTTLFEITGNVKYLKDAEVLLDKSYSLPSLNKDEYGRSLAYNYIAQHRFKDALQLLETIYNGISNKRSTELMLFDVYLETGEYNKAHQLLSEFENKEDFDYLIRMAKWNDHLGNSEAVVRTMEKVTTIVESRKDKNLMTWTYNNLATVYGHSGRIKDSYHYFLKSLEINPEQVVPKRGIAWIVYSYERDYSEANRILDSIMIRHNSPDHLLLRSELAHFNNNEIEMEQYKKEFIDLVEANDDYGLMFQLDLIELFAEKDPIKSIRLAELELKNRATPVIYSFLAYAHLRNDNIEIAEKIIRDHVQGKTAEPIAHYFSARVHHKAENLGEFNDVKEQIEAAQFELGPVRIRELSEL
jgi:tetratricopeptide (TPR) repeat protein